MSVIRYLLLTFLAISYFCILSAEADLLLWSKARSIAEANLHRVPGMTQQEVKTVNERSGEVIQSSKVTVIHYLDEDGKIINELLKEEILTDEMPPSEKNRMTEGLLEKDMTPSREGIFFEEIGDNLRVELTGAAEEIEGFHCLEYKVKYSTTGEDGKRVTFTGSIWLEENSGAPIYNILSMERTPRFVREIIIERWFDYEPDSGEWYQRQMNTTADIRVFLRRMTNTTRTTYQDYWLY